MDRGDSEDTLIQEVRFFLQRYFFTKKPLLLGYSGGPDSKALLYVLHQLQKEMDFSLLVAHIDHGWRVESGEEAAFLRKEVEGLGLPFFEKKIQKIFSSNLEERCRLERHVFFEDLCKKYGCEAVLLAHQKEDVMETVLKRFLEGAHFAFQGMSEISEIGGLVIWRPLLSVPKKELEGWLNRKNLSYFQDRTNEENRFLRSRMRNEIFPYLERTFAKNIRENLYHTSVRAKELQKYLDRKVASWFLTEEKGPLGSFFDLSSFVTAELVEKKHFFKSLFHREEIEVSRDVIEKLSRFLERMDRPLHEELKGCQVYIDRGFLFLCRKSFPLWEEVSLEEGTFVSGGWNISVTSSDDNVTCSWLDIWKGKVAFSLPEGKFILRIAKSGERIGKKRLGRYWQEHRVPFFFRFSLPVVCQGDEVYSELLCGNKPTHIPKWNVTLMLL
ncbi:MAG: tRNA lysidine(34) synthetase TilS [Chlamydiota bacterium]